MNSGLRKNLLLESQSTVTKKKVDINIDTASISDFVSSLTQNVAIVYISVITLVNSKALLLSPLHISPGLFKMLFQSCYVLSSFFSHDYEFGVFYCN